jgi:GDP-L-fucose synthase
MAVRQLNPQSRVFIAGHRGLVGSALVRNLRSKGVNQLILKTREELDLLDQRAVRDLFAREEIDFVFLAAATVGGIEANRTQQARFLYENLVIETNVIQSAVDSGVEKLLFLGSSCIYPKLAEQPIREDSLLTGPLEETNEGYAIAKIAGLKLCQMLNRQNGRRFISAMPTNLYGPGDNFHPTHSHVIPGMMRRFHEAKTARTDTVEVWGTGKPLREFLHVDDLAEALVVLMQKYESPEPVNVGTGADVTIAELAELMARTIGLRSKIQFNPEKPDGTPRKCLDISRILALDWKPTRSLEQGLKETYDWALAHRAFEALQAGQ